MMRMIKKTCLIGKRKIANSYNDNINYKKTLMHYTIFRTFFEGLVDDFVLDTVIKEISNAS